MNHAELVMRRRNVYAFIMADPIELVVVRPMPPVKNPETGGYLPSSETTLEPAIARIVQNVNRFNNGAENAEAGSIPNSEYRLIARHDVDLQPDDRFKWRGQWYKVLPHGIHPTRFESTLAAIELTGPENRGS